MNKLIIAISVGFVMTVFIVTAMLVSEVPKYDAAQDSASVCPKTYENDLLEFQYPCNWLLASDDNEGVIFTEFHEGGGTFKRYFWIRREADGFSECEDGEYFSERKMTIPSFDGKNLEACYHAEHGGATLTIRSGRSQTGYIGISSDGGEIESVIIPSLKVKSP